MSDARTEPSVIDGQDLVEAGAGDAEERVDPPTSGIDAVRILDGVYVLRSGTGERVLDICGNSCEGMANAQLYQPNGTGAQIFAIGWDKAERAMAILHGGLFLGCEDGNVCQTEEGDTSATRWFFEPVEGDDGWYFVRNACGGYLDVDGARDADGTNVKCWEHNGSPAQRWKLIPVSGAEAARIPDGDYLLRCCACKRVVEIEGDGSQSGANARLGRADGTLSQVLNIGQAASTGATYIHHAGLALDKEGGDGCGNVWQFEDNGTKAQRWFFEPVDDEEGAYFVRNLFGYYLTAVETEDGDGLDLVCRDFDGSDAQAWKLKAPTLAYATITLSEPQATYAGRPVEPACEVALASRVLEEGTDFEVTYKDNIEVGTATAKVSGTGAYEGNAKATFVIVPASLAGATVTTERQSFEHTGEAVRPKVTVTLDGARLAREDDYTVSYAENVEVGTATVTVSGLGNYEGTATCSFEIVPARVSLKKAMVTCSDTSFAYVGRAIEPDVTVTLKGETLAKDIDYTVSYADNACVGKATVEVTGIGAYKGSAGATFKISPMSLKGAQVTPEAATFAYTGDAIKPKVTVTLDEHVLEKGDDYSVSYADNVDAGTATIKVRGKGNYKGSAKATFKIAPASIRGAEVTPKKPSYAYTADAVKPKVTVTLDGRVLDRKDDYAVSYADNEAVGTATVTVSGLCNYEGTATCTFDILPAKVSHVKVVASGKGVTAEWEAQEGVDGYQVQYADDSDFDKVKTPLIVLGDQSTRVGLPERDGSSATYVMVRAFKDAQGRRSYSPWSEPKKAKRK